MPPKICMPRREKMKMKRKRMTRSEAMEEIEFTSDLTRFPIDAQYLQGSHNRRTREPRGSAWFVGIDHRNVD